MFPDELSPLAWRMELGSPDFAAACMDFARSHTPPVEAIISAPDPADSGTIGLLCVKHTYDAQRRGVVAAGEESHMFCRDVRRALRAGLVIVTLYIKYDDGDDMAGEHLQAVVDEARAALRGAEKSIPDSLPPDFQ